MSKNSRKLIYFLPFIPIILLSVFVIGIFAYIATPFTALLGYSFVEGMKQDHSNEPKPKVTYGEFPIELTYIIDGETKTVSDILICEYESYDETINMRYWNGFLKSTKKEAFLLYKDYNEKIYCRVGNPSWYMGDYEKEPELVIYIENFVGHSGVISEEKLYEKYKIEIVDWKTASPIENSFEEF